MSKQALCNVLAGVAFLIVAIVDFTRDSSSGIGVVFLVFAAVFVGFLLLAFGGYPFLDATVGGFIGWFTHRDRMEKRHQH